MPRPKTYVVTLTETEQKQLASIAKNYRYSQLERSRAQILLLTAQAMPDSAVAQKVGCTGVTVRNIRLRWTKSKQSSEPLPPQKQIKRARQEKRRERAFDGEKEARLIALTCSNPPEGASRWTLQLLQDRVIEMGIVEGVAKETIRRTLKKTRSNPG
jgi:transposase-like protein